MNCRCCLVASGQERKKRVQKRKRNHRTSNIKQENARARTLASGREVVFVSIVDFYLSNSWLDQIWLILVVVNVFFFCFLMSVTAHEREKRTNQQRSFVRLFMMIGQMCSCSCFPTVSIAFRLVCCLCRSFIRSFFFFWVTSFYRIVESLFLCTRWSTFDFQLKIFLMMTNGTVKAKQQSIVHSFHSESTSCSSSSGSSSSSAAGSSTSSKNSQDNEPEGLNFDAKNFRFNIHQLKFRFSHWLWSFRRHLGGHRPKNESTCCLEENAPRFSIGRCSSTSFSWNQNALHISSWKRSLSIRKENIFESFDFSSFRFFKRLIFCNRPIESIFSTKCSSLFFFILVESVERKRKFSFSCILTELMQIDLHKIIVSQQTLTIDHCKVFLYQILRGKKTNQTVFSFCRENSMNRTFPFDFRSKISSFSIGYSSGFESKKTKETNRPKFDSLIDASRFSFVLARKSFGQQRLFAQGKVK